MDSFVLFSEPSVTVSYVFQAVCAVVFVYLLTYRTLSQLCLENIFGFLVNTPSRMSLGYVPLPFQGKHWIAVRRVGDAYYDLDSKRGEPLTIGKSDSDVLKFLAAKLNCDGAKTDKSTELLLVLTAEVFRTGSWRHDSDSSSTAQSAAS